MKIKVKVSEILEVLNKIKHIAKLEKVKPVLGSGLFETLDDKIKITVTSFTNHAVVTVPAIIEQQGKCLIEINQIVSILGTLSGEVSIEDAENVVWIRQNKTKCRLNIMNISEYPVNMFKIDNPEAEFSMSSKALFDGLKKVVKFTEYGVSSILSGVFININNSIAKFVSTDGNRLAVVIKSINNNDITAGFILPKESINNLLPLIPDCDEVDISFNSGSCLFDFNGIQFCTRLHEGQFPRYEGIIPKENKIAFNVNKEELKYALERVGVVETKEDLCRVYLTAKENTITVESKDYKCNDVLNISDKKGEDIYFILNRVYLETVLSVISTDVVKFSMNTPSSAILFNDMENSYLVMPVIGKGAAGNV